MGGVLEVPSAYYCKHPPVQYTDDVAFSLLKDFIANK
jgi:myo-inositol-1-phosphate synthase